MSRQAKTKAANLTINPKTELLAAKHEDTPPPQASPMFDLSSQGIDLSSFGGDFSAPLMTIPGLPQSPPASPRVEREGSKTFLTNFKSRLNSEQDQRAEPPQRRGTKDDEEFRPSSSSMSKIYHLRKNPGSTPELSLVGSAEGERKQSDDVNNAPTPEPKAQPLPPPNEDATAAKRKDKGFRNPLARTKSIRRDSNSKSKPTKQSLEQPPKTAPLSTDWQATSEMLLKPKGKQKRGKSAERAIASESEENLPLERTQVKEKDKHGFVTGSKNVMNKAKTGGGNLLNKLGKLGRTGSNHEKELPDSEYVIKVINLPLIEQTRITRISKDLGSCRDKTEFWMPSLPWRCIDYLNLNCESEGLYRVPGSGPQVKHWQRRFDTELDLDLLDEEELYDPNIISSMLKSWLRDLPTEIMPKVTQQALADEISKDNPNYQRIGEEVPQKVRDALSELSPFNYYLLFAITCHLSLLLSHKDKNKMDLNNLSICIGPCLDLDRWLFNYLVGDWRRCWQGCYTEKQFLEAEKAYEQGSDYEVPVSQEKEPGQSAERSKSTAVVDEKTADAITAKSSRQASTDDGAKSPPALDKPTPPLPPSAENMQPDPSLASLPDYSHYVNGSVPPTPERRPLAFLDSERPSTAQAAESPKVGTTPKAKPSMHSRSHSDAPLPPIQPAGPVDFPFKVRNE